MIKNTFFICIFQIFFVSLQTHCVRLILNTSNMTKSLRHTLLLLAAFCLVVSCEDRAIPADQLGTDGISQGKIKYDTIQNMRDLDPGPKGDTIDVAEAVRLGLQLPVGSTSTKSYYVLGSVKGFNAAFDPNYGNASPIIANKINNRQMICYRLKSFKNSNFTDAAQLQIGDVVVVYGQIQNRYGAPQITQGGYLVTSDNPESGYKPGPRIALDESFDEGLGVFALVNKKAASADVWKHVAATETAQGFMSANAKINDAIEEAESWLVSPTMDLAACKKGAVLTFSHYYIGAADQRDQLLQVLISKDGGSSWEPLTLTDEMWNNGKLKRFTSARIDLTSYATATCQVAFAYKSTSTVALQWAVQNVRIAEPDEE